MLLPPQFSEFISFLSYFIACTHVHTAVQSDTQKCAFNTCCAASRKSSGEPYNNNTPSGLPTGKPAFKWKQKGEGGYGSSHAIAEGSNRKLQFETTAGQNDSDEGEDSPRRKKLTGYNSQNNPSFDGLDHDDMDAASAVKKGNRSAGKESSKANSVKQTFTSFTADATSHSHAHV